MPTLPLPDPSGATGRTREVLELAARRQGQTPENLSDILRAQAHWPSGSRPTSSRLPPPSRGPVSCRR